MKSLIIKKFKNFSMTYEKMDKSRKRAVLFGIFSVISLFLTETLLLQAVDKYNVVNEEMKEEILKKNDLNKNKQEIILKNAYKTEKSLNNKKELLLKDIESLLKNNSDKNYISPTNVPLLIESIVGNIGQLKMVTFKNIPKQKQQAEENILIKHKFLLKVEGNFQNIYELIIALEKTKGINVSFFNLKKEKDVIVTEVEFFVINTNKNLLSF